MLTTLWRSSTFCALQISKTTALILRILLIPNSLTALLRLVSNLQSTNPDPPARCRNGPNSRVLWGGLLQEYHKRLQKASPKTHGHPRKRLVETFAGGGRNAPLFPCFQPLSRSKINLPEPRICFLASSCCGKDGRNG